MRVLPVTQHFSRQLLYDRTERPTYEEASSEQARSDLRTKER